MAIKALVRAAVLRGPVSLRAMQELRMEMHLAGVRLRNRLDLRWRRRARQLHGPDVKLHFGCGTRILNGWVNVDGWDRAGVDLVWDLRQPLPLPDGACRLIFTEHVLEHIDRQFRAAVFRELFRLLGPGGVLRIVVPDCSRYAEAYVRGDLEWFRVAAPGYGSPAEGLNTVFVDHFHRFVDDFGSLSSALEEAGFTLVRRCRHRGSAIPELQIDLENESRNLGNLYVEAMR